MGKIPAGAARKAARRERKAAENPRGTAAAEDVSRSHRKKPRREESDGEEGNAAATDRESDRTKKKSKRESSAKEDAVADRGENKASSVRGAVEKVAPSASSPLPMSKRKDSKVVTTTVISEPAKADAAGHGLKTVPEAATLPEDARELFVRFLPRDCDEAEAGRLFSECGPLAKPVSMLRDYATGGSKGACFVTFETAAGAAEGLKLHGRAMRGRRVLRFIRPLFTTLVLPAILDFLLLDLCRLVPSGI